MARLAYRFALATDRVRADVIEASEYPELARKYEIRAVPKTIVNERYDLLGAVPPGELLKTVMAAGGPAPPDAPPPSATGGQ